MRQRVIERDWYVLGEWSIDAAGNCKHCGHPIAGVFDAEPGHWGARRLPVSMHEAVASSAD